MNLAMKSILAACFVTLPSLALAQDTTSPDQAPATEETPDSETAPSVADQLSTGTPVETRLPTKDEVVVGEEYLLDVSGDWQIRCAKTEEEFDPCQLYQLLQNGEGPFAEISIFPINEPNSKAVAGATIITPLDTMLPPGILISVDSTDARRYPYSFCGSVGCVGRIGLLAEDIAAYKKGSAASLQIVPAVAPDQTATATISLKGFTLGYDKLVALQPKK
ncbi:MAG: invasion associated locus B family protein [Falsihalocynthiibacter arcticus]|uniref:invasion associated locus B family protein n=2 Tax=Roseobacteraceae TaxID=2854170 RepID=UPI00350F92D7